MSVVVLFAVIGAGCGEKNLAARYGTPFSPGEGLAYRSYKFELRTPSMDPFPVLMNGRYAYTVSLQDSHVEQVTEAVFDEAKVFTEELGAVKVDGKWGFIRLTSRNERLFEYAAVPVYEGAEPFSEGLAAVRTDGKYGYINSDGELLIAPEYQEAHFFSGGLAAVSDAGGWFFIDAFGNRIIPGPFEEAESFYDGLAAVKLEGKWGYIDTRGRLVIEAAYEEAWSFEYGGRAPVKKDGKWILISKP
jgi:hypothetical protein